MTAVALATGASATHAQTMIDRVHRHNGVDSGQIAAITPLEITISKNGVESKIPVEDIESVYLAGEPGELNTARSAIASGRLADAQRILNGIDTSDLDRDEIAAEVEFYTMLVKARLALAGQGDPAQAAAAAREFMTRRRSSFHVPQAIETTGELLAAAGDYAAARNEYARLTKARSEFFKLRAALLTGRAWQAEGRHAEATAEFDKVLASTVRHSQVEAMKSSATLDRAVSLAAQGRAGDAAATIAMIITKSDPEDAASLGRAYNALGDCYLQAKDAQGALFAFLHVDLLYDDDDEAHAKALHELVALWRAAGKDTRSQEAAAELAEKYPNSRWAAK